MTISFVFLLIGYINAQVGSISMKKSIHGLSQSEASDLLLKYGLNEIRHEQRKPLFLLMLEQFKSPLVIILIFACSISLVAGESIEAASIACILLINAVIGFFQEYRAENAISALRTITAPRARVLRDGTQLVIMASEVVPSDILLIESGDIVAADADVIEAHHLQVNESILTGESLPVDKSSEPSNRVFMGTAVTTGTALTQVVSTGMDTELGKIAHLISAAESGPTPLQIQLYHLGRSLLYICLFVVGFVALIGYWRGDAWLDILIFSISLAVAAVPEGLPAIVTVALAIGVQRLAARKALVRKLPSVEALGSVSVICTDKTGTLTTGKMRVRELWGSNKEELLKAAASCCEAELEVGKQEGTGDPTEIAILLAAREMGIEKRTIENDYPRISIEPFDPLRRRMSIFRSNNLNYVKGATESLLPLCLKDSFVQTSVTKAVEEMTAKGLRVLAVAVGHTASERELRFLGLIGLADPPRPEAQKAIYEARMAGIIPVMITGDHPQTATAIARELGLVETEEQIESRVHARATPEDKLKLVRHWKQQGAIVAMTGDGVNDAPALREAHIGIAMGVSGTEVTRQAADLILGDDNFATIVSAVREGRAIFQNIRKAIVYLLTGNFAEILVVLAAVLAGFPPPLLAAHLLWINLVTDALPALTLIADPLSPNIMKRSPRPPSEKLIGLKEWKRVTGIGLVEASVAFTFYFYLSSSIGFDGARNLVFPLLILSQLFRAFSARSEHRNLFHIDLASNLWLLGVVVFTGLLQASLHYIPLTQEIFGLKPLRLTEWLVVVILALIPVTVAEFTKWLGKDNNGVSKISKSEDWST